MNQSQISNELKRGNIAAFESAFKLYARELIMFAFSFTRDSDDAEDIVQDCFASLLQKPERWPNITDVRGYLFKMVQNQCLFYSRKKAVKELKQAQFIRELVSSGNVESSLSNEITEIGIFVQKILSSLTSKRSELFRLMYLEGKNIKQVAALLGVSTNTIKTQVRLAKKSVLSKFLPIIVMTVLIILV